MDKETSNLLIMASFKADIFKVLNKYSISFESDVAEEFRELISRISFTEAEDSEAEDSATTS